MTLPSHSFVVSKISPFFNPPLCLSPWVYPLLSHHWWLCTQLAALMSIRLFFYSVTMTWGSPSKWISKWNIYIFARVQFRKTDPYICFYSQELYRMLARYSVLSKSTDYNVHLVSISSEMHTVFCKIYLYFLLFT